MQYSHDGHSSQCGSSWLHPPKQAPDPSPTLSSRTPGHKSNKHNPARQHQHQDTQAWRNKHGCCNCTQQSTDNTACHAAASGSAAWCRQHKVPWVPATTFSNTHSCAQAGSPDNIQHPLLSSVGAGGSGCPWFPPSAV
jgi:hypothetical protein